MEKYKKAQPKEKEGMTEPKKGPVKDTVINKGTWVGMGPHMQASSLAPARLHPLQEKTSQHQLSQHYKHHNNMHHEVAPNIAIFRTTLTTLITINLNLAPLLQIRLLADPRFQLVT